ncbi:interleukin-3 receptor subunit alpha-like [Perognathus longimembris pacificus]|uniref:interleukin-3 receptor subunit alpha-like n=1 Tax=Perognathus longimembris pacificus TaxID=214514 RepID=UPI0020194A9E|nr:interleukin-3 receptor subunit alpha-like [Perognathus longimembris pacificus]
MPGLGLLLLLLLLIRASCPDQGPVIRNLRVDPERRRLLWELRVPASGVRCARDGGSARLAHEQRLCEFFTMSRCAVSNYTVTVEDPPAAASLLYPPPPLNPGAAPRNLSCWVHDVGRLSCAWAPGPAAPAGLRYALHWTDGSGRLRPCPEYARDRHGRRTGCLFPDVSALPSPFRATVTADGDAPGPAPCADLAVIPEVVERLSPPNVTGACNASVAALAWAPPTRFSPALKYRLRLRKEATPSSPAQETVEEDLDAASHRIPNPGTFWAQLAARRPPGGLWSPWGGARPRPLTSGSRRVRRGRDPATPAGPRGGAGGAGGPGRRAGCTATADLQALPAHPGPQGPHGRRRAAGPGPGAPGGRLSRDAAARALRGPSILWVLSVKSSPADDAAPPPDPHHHSNSTADPMTLHPPGGRKRVQETGSEAPGDRKSVQDTGSGPK